jgi:hypothetical protein
MLGNPVGTTMTLSLLPRIFSAARNGMTSADRAAAAGFAAPVRESFGPAARLTTATSDTAQTAVRIRDADMNAPSGSSSKAVILTGPGQAVFPKSSPRLRRTRRDFGDTRGSDL